MVKSSGGRPKGGGVGSAPSSPTRRLKKGGKRGRRLCHMEGCTLCPSFGFEGEVAVSCSHHKEDGMRNLTARRCQHDGCFTVANFGLPGDKPGYCAAHSTEGMVNRNKPRGSEGMLSGVTVARSSRRATKSGSASIAELHPEEPEASEAPPSIAAAGGGSYGGGIVRSRSSSGGKDLLLRAAISRVGGTGLSGDGAFGSGEARGTGKPVAATRARSNARRRPSFRDKAILDGDEHDEFDEPMGNGGREGEAKNTKAEGRKAAVPPPLVASFAAQGDDLDSSRARLHAAKARSGAGRVRVRGDVRQGLVAEAVMAGNQRQEAFMPVSRGSGGSSRGGRAGMPELSFTGIGRMDGGSTLMNGCFLGGRGAGAPPGGVDVAQAELHSILLGNAGDMPEVRPRTTDGGFLGIGRNRARCARPPSGRDPHCGASRMVHGLGGGFVGCAGLGRGIKANSAAFESSSSNSNSSSMTGGGEAGTSADVFGEFGLDHLPELNNNDFIGLRDVGTGSNHLPTETHQHQQHQQHQQRQHHIAACESYASSASGPAVSSFEDVRLGVRSSTVFTASSVVSDDVSSEAFSSCDGSSVSVAATAGAAAARPTSNGSDALVPTKTPSEDAWWDILEGEEFVAMPEPVWGGGLDTRGRLEHDSLRSDPCGWQSGGGGGSEIIGDMAENGACAPSRLGKDAFGSSGRPGRGGGPHGDRGAATSQVMKTRPLVLSSSGAAGAATGLGGVLVMPGDDGFTGDISSRRNHGDNGVVDGLGGPGDSVGRSRGEGRRSEGHVGPASKRFAASVGDSDDAFPSSPFRPDGPGPSRAVVKPLPRDLGPTSAGGIFSSASSSSPNGIYPVGFGLTVHHSQVPLPHGGAGLRSGGQGLQGGYGGGGSSSSLSRAWVAGDTWSTGDATSPSKCLSLSPGKVMSTSPSSSALPLLAQSTPPWGTGPLYSPKQTRAAGRA